MPFFGFRLFYTLLSVFLSGALLSPALLNAQRGRGPAPTPVDTQTQVTASGSGPYTFNATVTPAKFTSPITGTATFTDLTSNRVLGTVNVTPSPFRFAGPVRYPFAMPGTSSSIAVRDLNGDSKPDFVVATETGLSIFLGQGDGTFQSPITYSSTGISSVAVGDFDNDGIPDLAVTNPGSSFVAILIGDGTGHFGSPKRELVSAAPFQVAVGDFDKDGYLDLVVVNQTDGTISVLRGAGNGVLTIPDTYTVGSRPGSVAVGYLDQDDTLDLVVTNSGDNTVSVLMGAANGRFANQITYPVGMGPNSVALGDFDGDFNTDLVVSNRSSNSVSLLIGRGDGTFGPQSTFSVGTAPNQLTVADFNADNHLDVAVVNFGSGVSLLLGNGSGSFAPAVTYSLSPPLVLASADLDGNGTPDLITGNDDHSANVLLNNVLQTGVASLPNASIIGTGSHTIQASYSGASNINPSSGTVSVAASQLAATLSLSVPATATAGQSVQLVASLNNASQSGFTAGGTVTFTANKNPLGSAPLSSGTATLGTVFATSGSQSIQATYSGDANFAPATSTNQTITVIPASSFTIKPYPSTEYAVFRGQLGAFLLQLQSVNGFQGSVRLSCSGGPAGSYCANLPQTITLKGTALALSGLYFPPQTKPGTYTITFTGTSGSTTASATARFIVK